jgi:hypothetical protein
VTLRYPGQGFGWLAKDDILHGRKGQDFVVLRGSGTDNR